MASSTRLTIPSPCSQPWQAMSPDQQGRFYTQCQKTVVDFTAMTDAQVMAYVQQPGGPGCGRFRSDQLNRVLVEPLNRRVIRWQWASLLLSGWLSSQTVQAQSGTEPNGGAVVHNLDDSTSVNTSVDSAKPSATVMIEGQILDARDKSPMPAAFVLIRDTKYGTSADTAGRFRLLIPSVSTNDTVRLRAGLIGYVHQEIDLPVSALSQPLRFELQEDSTALSEVINIGGYVAQKPTLWRRIRNWFSH